MTDTTGKTRADLLLAAGMIPLLHGAQEADDDQNDDATGGPDDQADADRQPDDQANDGPDDTEDDDQVDVAELKVRLAEAEAEAARYKRRLLASDLRKKQVERDLAEARRTRPAPTKPEDDGDAQARTPDPDDDTARELAALRREVQDSRVRARFDGYGKHQWQNPDAAWRLLDLTEVRDADGKVDEDDLHDAADALAKANPWLVKTEDTSSKPKADRPSGHQPGAPRRQDKPDKTRLASRFGALNGRV